MRANETGNSIRDIASRDIYWKRKRYIIGNNAITGKKRQWRRVRDFYDCKCITVRTVRLGAPICSELQSNGKHRTSLSFSCDLAIEVFLAAKATRRVENYGDRVELMSTPWRTLMSLRSGSESTAGRTERESASRGVLSLSRHRERELYPQEKIHFSLRRYFAKRNNNLSSGMLKWNEARSREKEAFRLIANRGYPSCR